MAEARLGSESKVRCCEFWDIPFASREWREVLAARFASPPSLEKALLALGAEESRVVSALYLNGGNQPRSFLLTKTRIPAEEFGPILERLADLGFLDVLKNRSRLNDSADRVIMNEDIFQTLTEARLVASPPAPLSPLQLALEDGELPLRLPALIQAAGGFFPEEALSDTYADYTDLHRALFAFPQGFAAVWRLPDGRQENARSGHARKIFHRLDGQAMLALALKSAARQRLRACEGALPGKRELTAMADAHGFSLSQLKGCFLWLSESGWIAERESALILTGCARAWLRGDMAYRFQKLRECAHQDGVLSPHGRAESVQSFMAKRWKKPLESIADYREYLDSLRRSVRLLLFYWSCGAVSLHCDEGIVQKIVPADLEEYTAHNDEKVVMAGDMSIVIAEDDASPLTRLYLSAFTRIERDSGVIRARLTEKLFAEGLAAGFDGLIFLRHLERISARELPQSIVFTIRDWVLSRSGATVRKSFVLHLGEERADEIMHDPVFLKLVDRRAGAHDIILGECDEREIISVLERHGVYLDFDPDM